jgi:maltooligosyltrehalose trehalohydrolase
MRRRHTMPFGAEALPDGSVRFRLWAPNARSVELCLEDTGDVVAMSALEHGWYELTTARAVPGSRYRYRIDGDLRVPDPASRSNPNDVHEPSVVVDPTRFTWQDASWHGRPWEEAVIYELHVGTFSPEGTFAGAMKRLDYLQQTGVTVIELMPVADFPGRRNWGYDGVLPFAPDAAYGTPDDLKALIQAAHARGLMVFLDVVYNHFGPDGNYLGAYAKEFFTERHHTPWGAAINFDGDNSRPVREFFIHNAIYWLEEFHFDGLRFDAVHAIIDDSPVHILDELAQRVRAHFALLDTARHIHLVLENEHNQSRFLKRDNGLRFNAQWNDDIHHALHVLTTGERDGYYIDYADRPAHHLGRCLTEGFAYQGDASVFRHGDTRGEPSADLPPLAFVNFLQNHDQIGNRAFGERIHALSTPRAAKTAAAILLLAPSPPLLFMGEEFGAATPFQYFCDFSGDLARAVRDGRRREFARFEKFADPAVRERIPDPNDESTFARSKLDWNWQTAQEEWSTYTRNLLHTRQRYIVPRLAGTNAGANRFELIGEAALRVAWRLGDGSWLTLLANVHDGHVSHLATPDVTPLAVSDSDVPSALARGVLPGWSAVWFLQSIMPVSRR